ncbi:hypothetical protein GF312_15825 [Candidatus Poribacteria bacterium]|nr:hypothetical protein [Candidatus Poribacteria bacterium]
MKVLKNLIILLMSIMLAVMLVGCSDDEDEDEDDNIEGDVVVLTGVIEEDMTLTSDKNYLLRGGVFIGTGEGENVTLTIEAGTTIYGESATKGMLVISRGSKIIAEGTASAPIILTSDKAVGQRNRGDWGGLIINGNAPLNTGDEAYGEGGTGYYGGNNPNDNSGILKYVRVEFAGREISPDNELNGIAFQAVGSGTVVEYVQVHMNKDDGIEMFGGNVNIKYALVTGAADDSFDWTDGWQGKAQFVVAQQYADDSDNGIEADNNGEDNIATPISNPTIYNLTLIGAPGSEHSDIGMLLREGTKAKIYNGLIVGFQDSGLDVDHAATFDNADAGELVVDNCVFYDNVENFKDDDDGDDTFDEGAFGNKGNNLEASQAPVADPYNQTAPDFSSQGPATSHAVKSPPSDGFFESVNFIGGVDPNNDWTVGWTTSDPN